MVESLRKWKHNLAVRYFTLVIDQLSVSFMFDNNKSGNIKNDKILRWSIALSSYSFILRSPGCNNFVADALSRSCCSKKLYESLCHPGITRIMPDGRETTVATRHLAPMADIISDNDGRYNLFT
ncbi:uncharacterized protein LOC124816864 [Hydra vulgaris]|uniref:uncharacterized protein LOC124816864 n=1 Tax=Hydra vulgaris TaxID=6087 RepID=UPI001F5FAEE8|nr:uncharacterized protein LOC124816864 [Hydra vulgaris]